MPPSYTVGFRPNHEEILYFSVTGYENATAARISCPEWLSYNNDAAWGEDGRIHFSVTLRFPSEIKTPGEHRCGFIVQEYQDPNIPPTWSGIRAIAQVGGTIIVDVPYPKKYATLDLEIPSQKKGEPIFASVNIKNYGIEEIYNVKAKIEIFDIKNSSINTVETTAVDKITTHQTVKLWKKIDTTLYEAAKYRAVATFDYGGDEIAKDEELFFIGTPHVEVLKSSENATANKLNDFQIEVESWWGDVLQNVYAFVNISNETFSREFKTVNTDLNPWTTGLLEGYFDATGFNKGEHRVEIMVRYYGDKETIAQGTIMIYEEKEEKEFPMLLVIIISGVALLLIINISWVIYSRRKNLKNKEAKTKERE